MKLNMVGRLTECILLWYRTPASHAQKFLPSPLALVTKDDWAFWNIVVVRVEKMRPRGLPSVCGLSYVHVAYRLCIRTRPETQQSAEGLYFVRSDVNQGLMAKFGNRVTDFHLHRADIDLADESGILTLAVQESPGGIGDAQLSVSPAERILRAPGSCFGSLEEADLFLRYHPLGLSTNGPGTRLRLAEVFRDESQWIEMPIHIDHAKWNFFEYARQKEVVLERAIRVAPIDYRWRLGRTLPLTSPLNGRNLGTRGTL